MKIPELVTNILDRLDDPTANNWTREELTSYAGCGYDDLCRDTKCLFDQIVLDSLAPIGNYNSYEEKVLAEAAGFSTCGQFNFTNETERNYAPSSAIGPVHATAAFERAYFSQLGIPSTNPSDEIPSTVVDVFKVFHDELVLSPEVSAELEQYDRQYEFREGFPRKWVWDKDGLFRFRRVPISSGEASYDDVTGDYGTVRSESSFTGTISGSWGILREDAETFPAGGPWGIPRRLHPDANNTVLEVARLGRDGEANDLEVPRNYAKYIEFYVMSRALFREGPGQDVKLAQHFAERFELGKRRMQHRQEQTEPEYVAHMGRRTTNPRRWGLGDPTLPWEYGRQINQRGGY